MQYLTGCLDLHPPSLFSLIISVHLCLTVSIHLCLLTITKLRHYLTSKSHSGFPSRTLMPHSGFLSRMLVPLLRNCQLVVYVSGPLLTPTGEWLIPLEELHELYNITTYPSGLPQYHTPGIRQRSKFYSFHR